MMDPGWSARLQRPAAGWPADQPRAGLLDDWLFGWPSSKISRQSEAQGQLGQTAGSNEASEPVARGHGPGIRSALIGGSSACCCSTSSITGLRPRHWPASADPARRDWRAYGAASAAANARAFPCRESHILRRNGALSGRHACHHSEVQLTAVPDAPPPPQVVAETEPVHGFILCARVAAMRT